ncbi:MAG TPA: efflux RND transporter periplasmic adaptor subunit [Vicinamibacterales bacterium]|nr:efflux RND transporter periplasmic adaptor subunit [Vicinamibacterales bacterium]
MTRRRILAGLVLLAAIGGAAYYSLHRRSDTLVLTGIVDGNDVVVSSKITGRIESLPLREGDEVKAGTVVAVLDHQELRAALEAATAATFQARQMAAQAADQVRLTRASVAARISQARAQVQQAAAQRDQAQAVLDQAASNDRRIQALFTQGLETAQDRDNAQATREGAQAGLMAATRGLAATQAALRDAEAQQQQVSVQERQVEALRAAAAQVRAARLESQAKLAQSEVLAPVSGIVSLRAAREGEVVNPGDPIITIFQLSDTWIQADVQETYADLVRLGQVLTVRLPSGAEVSGPVIYKAVEASFATQRDVSQTKRDIRTVAIRIRVANAHGRLVRGMTAYVLLPIGGKGRA